MSSFLRLILMGALAVLISGCAGGNKAPKYRTAKLERGAIESLVSATGTVRPVVQVNVGSQVSGTVQKLSADYNDRVKRGQVLLELDPSSFRARAVQSEAAVARAKAALKEAERQFRRAGELVGDGYIPQSEIEAKEVEVEQRQADLMQAQAQLEAAQVDLNNTVIRSPIDGVVIARSVDLGQTVAASLQSPQLFLIANDLADMQVETRIDEADIGSVRAGLEARFTVDAFPDENFTGKVAEVRLEPIAEQGVVTYTTVIRTSNPDLKLRPGMTANVAILIASRDDVLKAPAAALRFRPNGAQGKTGGGTSGQAGAARADAGGSAGASNVAVAGERGDARRAMGATPGDTTVGRKRRPSGGAASGAIGRTARAASGADRAEGGKPQLKPGSIYILRDGKPERIPVMTGLTNGTYTEVVGEGVEPSTEVIVGLEISSGQSSSQTLQPPPGMGGRGGPGGGGGGTRSGRR